MLNVESFGLRCDVIRFAAFGFRDPRAGCFQRDRLARLSREFVADGSLAETIYQS